MLPEPADHVAPSSRPPGAEAAGGQRDRLPPTRVPFLWMLAGLLLGAATWWIPGWRLTGHVPYVVDDAWIHLTIARNLRDHGTFGVVPGVYESASSAPGWNLLLAPLGFLPVPLDWWPIILNLLAAAWILWRLAELRTVRRMAGSAPGVLGLVVVPVAMGLPQIAATGMEHLLQAAVAVEILRRVARRVDGLGSSTVALFALGFVGTLLRFETAFLVAASCVALVVGGSEGPLPSRVRKVVGLALGPVAAIAAFASVNVAFGQSLLPNSVLAKSSGSLISFGELIDNLRADPTIPALALLTAALAARGWVSGNRSAAVAGFAAVGATSAHLLLAEVGNFDRYQEWLLVILFWSALANAAPSPERTGAGSPRPADSVRDVPVAAVVAVILLLAVPRVTLLRMAPGASEDIHLLQEQTARFLDEYHDTDGVGLHDLGWVAWLHDGPIVDLEGLSTHEVMLAIRSGTVDRDFVARLFDESDVSVVASYDGIFDPILPAGWSPAGTWCVRTPRVVLSAECFTFYGRTEAERSELRRQLAEFESELPEGVSYRAR